MKGSLKILSIVVGLLLALVLIAVIAVMLLIDPDDYRQALAAAVESQTGRQLAIDGDMSLEFVPCCGIAIGRTRLSNPAGFTQGLEGMSADDSFASLENLGLQVRIWPLLTQREIVIGRMRLQGLTLALISRADGRNNWTFDTSTDKNAPVETTTETGELPRFSVEGISIRDVNVDYRDLATGDHYRVNDLRMETGPVAPGKPFELTLALTAADVGGDMSVQADLRADARFDLDAQTASLSDVAGDIRLSEGLSLDNFRIEGLRFDLADTVGTVKNLSARAIYNGVPADITADAVIAETGVTASGKANVPEFSPRKVIAEQDLPETADPAALTRAGGSLDWRLGDDSLALNRLDFAIDNSRITGSAGIRNFDSPSIAFDVDVDAIDLDRYLAPEPETVGEDEESSGSDEELPLETLRDLDLDGKLRIGQLQVTGIRLEELAAKVTAKKGRIRFDPLSARLYQGRYKGTLILDATGSALSVNAAQELSDVRIGELLDDLAEPGSAREMTLAGGLGARMNLAGSGTTQDGIVKDLRGDVSLDMTDGALVGIDLWHEIQSARALIRRNPAPAKPAYPRTQINTLSASGRLADGVLDTSRIVAEIPFLRVTGNGRLGLLDETLRYRFKANVIENPTLENGAVLSDLKGLTIPLTLEGSFADPKLGVELKDLTKEVAKEKVRERLLEELGEDEAPPAEGEEPSTRDRLKKGLRDLLKQ